MTLNDIGWLFYVKLGFRARMSILPSLFNKRATAKCIANGLLLSVIAELLVVSIMQ